MTLKINYMAVALMAALSVAMMVPSVVMATANDKLDLVQDRSAGGSEAIDMLGDTGFGFLNYNQNHGGALRLVVSLKNASPNTTYEGVYLVGGPSHATATGFIDIGTLTTNNQGNGTATLWVSLETLQAVPFGSGPRTDHFDLIGPDGDIYAASVLTYLVP